MSPTGEVIVKVSKDGSVVEVDAVGFKGKTCEDFMSPITRALGKSIEKKNKPEFYKTTHGGVSIGGR